MTRRYTTAQVINAIAESKGMLTQAARRLGCNVHCLYSYRDNFPTVRQALYEEREKMGDTAELALYNAILKGEGWAIAFYLRTQAKDRGYVERKELTGKDGSAIDMKITEMVVRMPEAIDEDGEDE